MGMRPSTPSPLATLLRVFALWKGALLLIAVGSALVGQAYDTSASLLLADRGGLEQTKTATATTDGPAILARLISWDAIYFTEAADRGYVFEQEWAFGTGLPVVISSVLKALKASGWIGSTSGVPATALVGVVVAHLSHLLSAVALLWLGRLVLCRDQDEKQQQQQQKQQQQKQQDLALVAACLHVLSPAGLFLSAPYAEAPFALLSFAGLLLFAKGRRAAAAAGSGKDALAGDVLTLLAGISFGLATAFRTNGLLNGVQFAYAFCAHAAVLFSRPSFAGVRQLVVLGLGGLFVAAGSVVPQAVAYSRYCSVALGTPTRPWCDEAVPSIYSFVQRHYWGTGLFRYWTISNLPLFLLAAPMLCILFRSGWDFALAPSRSLKTSGKKSSEAPKGGSLFGVVRSMAVAQLLIAAMTLTSYHVQIITRLSSGYPVWYWWVAERLASDNKKEAGLGRGIVVFMVMYGSIQAVLFSSFLPPA